VIICLTAAPGRAFGWGQTLLGQNLEQMINTTQWRQGALHYSATLGIQSAGYDSDIYYGSLAQAVPDSGFTVGPDVRMFFTLAKGFVLDLEETPQYVYYANTIKDRALNNTFRGQVHVAADRFYFEAGGTLIDAKERLSSELNMNVRRWENQLTGLGFWQISRQLGAALQYRLFSFAYEDTSGGIFDYAQNLNRTENYVNLTGYLQQAPRTRVYLDAEFGSFSFKDPVSKFKDSRSYGFYAGIEFLPEALGAETRRGTVGTLNIGFKRLDVLDPSQKDFNGWVANTNISVNVWSTTTLRFTVSRDVQFSVYAGLAGYIQTAFSAGVTFAVSRKIDLLYDFSLDWNDYGQLQSTATGLVRLDHYRAHAVGCDLRILKNLTARLMASAGERSSNAFPEVYPRYFIGFDLTYGHPTQSPALTSTPFRR